MARTAKTARADLLLVERGLAGSRAQAQALIADGRVFARASGGAEALVQKPSQALPETSELAVRAAAHEEFVSRAGRKLEGALARTGHAVAGARVLDIGLSTGGFADCVLRRGAAFVLGVDVGRDQLHPSLRGHPRLRSLEGVNARELTQPGPGALVRAAAGEAPFDLVVADVSFISLTLVLPSAIQYLKSNGWILALVKPQFEAGREGVGKGGIVKDPAEHEKTRLKILDFVRASALEAGDYFESSIDGADGNKEFFLYARKP